MPGSYPGMKLNEVSMSRCLVFSFLFFVTAAYAGSGATLTGTHLTSCKDKVCVEVKSNKAYQGTINSGSIFFASPTIAVTENTKPSQTWQAESVFFDNIEDRLFIRALQKNPTSKRNFEAYYDLLQGRLFIIR